MNILFLDIDGVLNGYNYFTNFKMRIAFKLYRDFKWINVEKYKDLIESIELVDKKKVKILSKIIKENHIHRIIMIGSKRYDFEDYKYRSQNMQMSLLNFYFLKYGIDISDYTPYITGKSREDEILKYIHDNQISDNYIILDDEIQLYHKLRKHVLLTADSVIIKGHPRENTGLKKKHIKESIELFKEV